MEELKDKIISLLKQENVKVEYFNIPQVEDILIEEPIELALQIEENDLPKWKYFDRKLNSCKEVVKFIYKNNIGKFIFQGSNNEVEKDLIERNLQIFYEALSRKYFKVNPSVNVFSVLIKPTHRCNLDCKYCYDKPYRQVIKEDMSLETLDRILYLLSNYAEKVQFIWHGGEPTVVGLDWYKEAYEQVFTKYPMVEFEFSLMSNGINLTEEWFDFFKKYNITPGASYNSFYQTDLRTSNQNKSDLSADNKISKIIESNFKYAIDRGISLGVIEVITSLNYKKQIDIYEHYKKNKLNIVMNHVFYTDQAKKYNLMDVTPAEYVDEFLKYFKHWLFDKDGISERSAEEALKTVIGATYGLTCKYEDCRYKWLGINPLGEIYPCDRYFPEKYKVGTIFDHDSVDEILKSEAYSMYSCEVKKRFDTKCEECGYWSTCKGGCNGSAIEVTGSAEGVEEFVCEIFRRKFNGVYNILRDLDWVNNENINPHARKILIQKGFFSIKEIKQFLKEMKIDFKLEYDKNDLLKCSEYEIFRGINYVEGNTEFTRHIDFVDSFEKKTVIRNKERRNNELLEYLRKIAISSVSKM